MKSGGVLGFKTLSDEPPMMNLFKTMPHCPMSNPYYKPNHDFFHRIFIYGFTKLEDRDSCFFEPLSDIDNVMVTLPLRNCSHRWMSTSTLAIRRWLLLFYKIFSRTRRQHILIIQVVISSTVRSYGTIIRYQEYHDAIGSLGDPLLY